MDWDNVLTKSILTLVPAAATWLFTTVSKLRSDMNAAFRKIRALEIELGCEDSRDD